MPTPYRRSCQQCVKAKRRCNLGTPCYRCRVRQMPCDYTPTPLSSRSAARRSSATVTTKDQEAADSHVASLAPDSLNQGQSVEESMMTALAEDIDAADAAAAQINLPDFPDHDLDWNEIMGGIDDFAVPDRLEELTATDGASATQHSSPIVAGQMYQERVVYAVKRLKVWPLDFGRHAHAPFINLPLYRNELPNVLRDAMGMCSLYANRTDSNEHVVARCISQAAKACTAQLSTMPQTALSLAAWLPAVQALCLYETIQLFDGNITMRAEAEVALPLLLQHLRALRQVALEPAGHNVPTTHTLIDSIDPTSADDDSCRWHRYLLLESVRRTLAVGFFIDCLLAFLKQGWDDPSDFVGLSMFAQRALWAAPSLYHWELAATAKPWFPVRFGEWERDTQGIALDDLDDLGVAMMALVKGIDHCRRWVGLENLERFDLLPPVG